MEKNQINKYQVFIIVVSIVTAGWLAITSSDNTLLFSCDGVNILHKSNMLLHLIISFAVLTAGFVLVYTVRSRHT